jgi:hypothetical protein
MNKVENYMANKERANREELELKQELNDLFDKAEKGLSDEGKKNIHEAISRLRRHLIKSYDKEDAEEIANNYYKKLKEIEFSQKSENFG